jgi:hypothetical protein
MESTSVVRLKSGINEFCIGRIVTKVGLLTIGATRGLRAAKARIEELTETWPGDYVVSFEIPATWSQRRVADYRAAEKAER